MERIEQEDHSTAQTGTMFPNNQIKRAGSMVQVVEYLPSNLKSQYYQKTPLFLKHNLYTIKLTSCKGTVG
jgi:hypothetical protein